MFFTTTLSVAQTRIQLYPLIEKFESGEELAIKIKSRSGAGAVLVSAEYFESLVREAAQATAK